MIHTEAKRRRRELALQMAEQASKGKTLQEVGACHGVSQQRVHELFREFGIVRKVSIVYVANTEAK